MNAIVFFFNYAIVVNHPQEFLIIKHWNSNTDHCKYESFDTSYSCSAYFQWLNSVNFDFYFGG